jgi:hypothetical protein
MVYGERAFLRIQKDTSMTDSKWPADIQEDIDRGYLLDDDGVLRPTEFYEARQIERQGGMDVLNATNAVFHKLLDEGRLGVPKTWENEDGTVEEIPEDCLVDFEMESYSDCINQTVRIFAKRLGHLPEWRKVVSELEEQYLIPQGHLRTLPRAFPEEQLMDTNPKVNADKCNSDESLELDGLPDPDELMDADEPLEEPETQKKTE